MEYHAKITSASLVNPFVSDFFTDFVLCHLHGIYHLLDSQHPNPISNKCFTSSNKCLTRSNKCLTSSNKARYLGLASFFRPLEPPLRPGGETGQSEPVRPNRNAVSPAGCVPVEESHQE